MGPKALCLLVVLSLLFFVQPTKAALVSLPELETVTFDNLQAFVVMGDVTFQNPGISDLAPGWNDMNYFPTWTGAWGPASDGRAFTLDINGQPGSVVLDLFALYQGNFVEGWRLTFNRTLLPGDQLTEAILSPAGIYGGDKVRSREEGAVPEPPMASVLLLGIVAFYGFSRRQQRC